MQESLTIILGKDSAFDSLVHGIKDPRIPPVLSQASAVTIATKDGATVGKKPGAVIAFEVHIPGMGNRMVQATVTVALLATMAAALKGRYGPGGPEAHRYGNDNPFI